MSSWVATHLWLIPAVPLVASIVILSLSNARQKGAVALAIVGQIFVLVMSVGGLISSLQTPGFRAVQNFTWFTFGEQSLRIGFVLDPLAAAMLRFQHFDGLPEDAGPAIRHCHVLAPGFPPIVFVAVLTAPDTVEIASFDDDPGYWSLVETDGV